MLTIWCQNTKERSWWYFTRKGTNVIEWIISILLRYLWNLCTGSKSTPVTHFGGWPLAGKYRHSEVLGSFHLPVMPLSQWLVSAFQSTAPWPQVHIQIINDTRVFPCGLHPWILSWNFSIAWHPFLPWWGSSHSLTRFFWEYFLRKPLAQS